MSTLKILDAHHHLWDVRHTKYLWLSAEQESCLDPDRSIMTNYLIADYLADAQPENVIKSVHIQAGWPRKDSVLETRWLQNIADQYGFPHGIVAYVNLIADDLEETLAAHCQYKNIRGVRQTLGWHEHPFYRCCEQDYLNHSLWQKNYALLKKYNLSFDMQIYPHEMSTAAQLAKQHPSIKIILNHAGMPLMREQQDFERWRQGLQLLAQHPNVFIKLSGFGMLDHKWTVASIRPYVEIAIDLFGVDRCMFASNFPVDKPYASYARLFGAYQAIVAAASTAEKQQLFFENAERIYRI